jgi:hypothetical protein
MIPRRLEDISEADLDHLVANSVAEGKTIQYKKALPALLTATRRNSWPTSRHSQTRPAAT